MSGTVSSKPKHPTYIEGWNGTLEELAQVILRMRYDKVMEFFGHCVAETERQSEGDKARGRLLLSKRLKEAAHVTKILQKQFWSIWKLCQPHMDGQ
ncbi:MAG: hypothetical protein HYT93_03585 [Parcubacteria group bacterium]|nr:hypothetical protein [Parcubacteria group bacterium]